MKQVILKPGKERSIKNHHPWIFSGAIKTTSKDIKKSDEVEVLCAKKQFLGKGYYNPDSQIRVRIYSWCPDDTIDESFLERRISLSIQRRASIDRSTTNAIRLVAHEADLLPGLVIDQYSDWVSLQILTAGMEKHRTTIIQIIDNLLRPVGIVERSDESVRKKEGLKLRRELIKGQVPDQGVEILENGMRLMVDIWSGHKTGFYIDQRNNRSIIRQYARDKSVLNCFSFTGGFAVAAALGGAKQIINVDESLPALRVSECNASLNQVSPIISHVQGDVFKYLRQLRDEGRTFDMIILDPPKFANSQRNLNSACRGYKDLNLLAWQLLETNGLLATFSCSGLISRDLFQKVVFGSTIDANCEAQIVKHLFQSEDHPTRLSFPESLYLKGFLLRKISS